ncbi:MAG: hypothetical protein HQM12_09520 [SAR324 cluster bacterium]|nr:hypothetical protein [SAR324 cluster bacterium]
MKIHPSVLPRITKETVQWLIRNLTIWLALLLMGIVPLWWFSQSVIKPDSKSLSNELIPIHFKTDAKGMVLKALDSSGKILAQAGFSVPVQHFSLSADFSRIAVLDRHSPPSVFLYELPSLNFIHQVQLNHPAEVVIFSGDSRFLALSGPEYNTIDLLTVPELEMRGHLETVLSIMAIHPLERSEFILARTAQSILKIQTRPLEITEENAEIPLKLGDEIMMVDPYGMCSIHGISHPLFEPDTTMTKGLTGYFTEAVFAGLR